MALNINPDNMINHLNILRNNMLELTRAQTHLATGKKVNQASEGPAVLSQALLLESQMRTLNQGLENTQFTQNMFMTAEGGVHQISSLVADLKTTVVAAANQSFGPEAQEVLQQQASSILSSIDRIAGTTRFGQRQLLNGASGFNTPTLPAEVTYFRTDQAVVKGNQTPVTIEVTGAGENRQVSVNGTPAVLRDDFYQVDSKSWSGTFSLAATTAPGTYTVDLQGQGLSLSATGEPNEAGNFGFPSLGTGELGSSSGLGSLDTILRGQANDFVNRPDLATQVIEAAQREVGNVLGRIGATSHDVLDRNYDVLSVAMENLSAAHSTMIDTDMAAESVNSALAQVKEEASLGLVQKHFLRAENILKLLT